jgi:hypothetical protein
MRLARQDQLGIGTGMWVLFVTTLRMWLVGRLEKVGGEDGGEVVDLCEM